MIHSLTPPPSARLRRPILPTTTLHRRSLLLLSTTLSIPQTPPLSLASPPPSPDTTITDRIFMDFNLCSTGLRQDRTLSDNLSTLCPNSVLLGRIVLGLYGHIVPITVSNFKSMCVASPSNRSSYKNTLVNKIFPDQYFLAGHQGRPENGEVRPPLGLPKNTEAVDSRSFQLTHSRAGLLSLCLSENEDEDEVQLDDEYRNVEFLITTGTGPYPELDKKNIVFGAVLEGLDTVTAIASTPTYRPSERIRQFNDFAEFLGDERAQIARGIWNKPLKTVYISDCGELKVAKPSLPPSLP